MTMKSAWLLDVKRAYIYTEGNLVSRIGCCLRMPGLQAVLVYRFGRWLKGRHIALRLLGEPFYFILNGLVKIVWGIELPRGATIGPGLYIGHFGGITISPDAVLGRNCNVS
ncbi:MAG TPA: hypothetical protein VL051_02215, partial [Burkholderiaceae bacterium]|nr:hypothetical protein [Burkholderiaceae bacterium]